MHVQVKSATVVTAADGSATAYIDGVNGILDRLVYVKTDYADTVDFTITIEDTGESLWTEQNVTASTARAPRQATHSVLGVAATLDGTRAALEPIAVNGRIKIVLANGGDAKTGVFRAITF